MPLYIEEYANLADVRGRDAQIPGEPLATETVAIGGSSARSTADFNEATQFLVLSADADCQFEVGDGTVTADADSRILFSGTYRVIGVKDSNSRIAVITKQ